MNDFPVSRAQDLAPAFAAMSQAGVDAVLVRRDVLVIERNRAAAVALAAERHPPLGLI